VSSAKQKEDLHRQIAYMREHFPEHEIIQDVGSGLNFKRKGFTSLLERSCAGDVKEVVVAHKDRLARFGFDLVRWLVERNGGKLVVLGDVRQSPESELTADLLSIIHVFSCRMRGLRKYGRAVKEDKALPHGGAAGETAPVGGNGAVPVQQDSGASETTGH
jgi:predicted site-specific integrase-resolvase